MSRPTHRRFTSVFSLGLLLCLLASLAACDALPSMLGPFIEGANPQPASGENTLPETPSPTEAIHFAPFNTQIPNTPAAAALQTELAPTPTLLPTATEPPEAISDLFFLVDEQFVRWDHVTNYLTPLAERVEDFSISAGGERIALLRPTQITANGVALYDLDLLDLHSKQIRALFKGIPRLQGLWISPDGRWVAYQPGAENSLYAISINDVGQPRLLGTCSQENGLACESVVWDPGSYALLWQDAQGIWISKLDKAQPGLVVKKRIEVTDPKGQKTALPVVFEDLSWSPGGRFILARLKTEAGVCWYAVLDTRQGRWIEAPGTFSQSTPTRASATWMDDGRLLVVRAGDPAGQPPATIDIWQIVPTRDEVLALDQEIELYQMPRPGFEDANHAAITVFVRWADQIDAQSIGFAVTSTNLEAGIYLYQVDLAHEIVTQINPSGIQAATVLWSPDHSGALLVGDPGPLQFILADGSGALQLNNLAGKQPGKFFWAPPEPRS